MHRNDKTEQFKMCSFAHRMWCDWYSKHQYLWFCECQHRHTDIQSNMIFMHYPPTHMHQRIVE